MFLYFDNTGRLLKSIEHGTPARSGSQSFEIVAVFNNNVNVDNMSVKIYLKKPDFNGTVTSEPIEMELTKSEKFEKNKYETDWSIYPFVDGEYYNVFRFVAVNDDEDSTEPIIDMPGLWNAYIEITDEIEGIITMQGPITFNVQNGPYDIR